MRTVQRHIDPADLLMAGVGAAATLVAAYVAVVAGAQLSLAALLGCAGFVAAVAAFQRVPHVAVAGTILLCAAIPALKVFVVPWAGATKDVLVVAAAVAAAMLWFSAGRRTDAWLVILVGLLLTLYVVNVGGGHGGSWAQGVRLVGEPLVLLVVGLLLPQPRRTLRWGIAALIAVAAGEAAIGLAQQQVGPSALVELGYEYNAQVRTIGDRLRSFGTFDDPFAYASFLLLGLGTFIFAVRRSPWTWPLGLLLLLGVAVSFVRTAGVIAFALGFVAVARRGFTAPSAALTAAVVVAAAALVTAGDLAPAADSGPRAAAESSSLNGRVEAWQAAVGDDPLDWVVGRGVGEVGTAADRASRSAAGAQAQPGAAAGGDAARPVDSGYLAAVADVGVLGLALLLALLGRLGVLSWGAMRAGLRGGALALGLLTVVCIDAVTRSAFTGFPSAMLAMLLIGVALAAAGEERRSREGHDALRP